VPYSEGQTVHWDALGTGKQEINHGSGSLRIPTLASYLTSRACLLAVCVGC
jgi:hypothetical protein